MSGWSQSDPSGLSYSVLGWAGPFRLPAGGIYLGSPYLGSNSNYLQIRLGPVVVDNIYLSYGAIYDDIHGAFPGRSQLAPDDRWGQIVSLNFRASFSLGNSIGVSIQPWLYYLPDKGQVGWGVPGPITGFVGYQPNAMALLQIAWNKQVGIWNLTAYDVFNPRIYQYNLWDIFLGSQASFGNLTPYERVGRYSLGYGGGDLTNYNPPTRFGIRGLSSWNGMAGYYNILGGRALASIGANSQGLLYLYRTDYWDPHFNDISAGIAGGAYIKAGDPNLTSYAGYNFYSTQPYNTTLNWAVVGARKMLGPAFTVYGQAGYYWFMGDNAGPSGSLVSLGLQQQLGPNTTQYLEVGRRAYTPVTGPYGVENYIDYRIMHMLGRRSILSGYVGTSERQLVTIGDYMNIKYAGLSLTTLLTMRLSAFAFSGWAYTASGVQAYVYDTWTHRFGLRYNLTENIQGQAFYQYQEVHSNSSAINYSEHFIYIGASKRF